MLGDRYEYLGCDRDVRVGRTMITGADGQRLKMLGAFAGRDLMPFEFLGFYTGDLLEFEDGEGPRRTSNHYTYCRRRVILRKVDSGCVVCCSGGTTAGSREREEPMDFNSAKR